MNSKFASNFESDKNLSTIISDVLILAEKNQDRINKKKKNNLKKKKGTIFLALFTIYKKKTNNFFSRTKNLFVTVFIAHKTQIIGCLIFVIISSTLGVTLSNITNKNFHKNALNINKIEPLIAKGIDISSQSGFSIPVSKILNEEVICVTRGFIRIILIKCISHAVTTIITRNYTFLWDDHLTELVNSGSFFTFSSFSIEEIN